MVELRLDHTPNVEMELCLHLSPNGAMAVVTFTTFAKINVISAPRACHID